MNPTQQDRRDQLLKRREEITSILRSLRHSLEANDLPSIVARSPEGGHHAWFWHANKFTHRGVEKSGELFNRFCSGHERMTYHDFRGYVAFFGHRTEVPAHVLDNPEAWRSFMRDLCGDSFHEELSVQNFVTYRSSIETDFPLEEDILACGASLLPERLHVWHRCQEAFDRLASENVSDEELHELRRKGEAYIPKVPVEEFQHLSVLLDEVLLQDKAKWFLASHFNHNRLMHDVREHHSKKSTFGEAQTSAVDAYERAGVQRSSIAAWFMSGRPRFPVMGIQRGLLLFKHRTIRLLRDALASFSTASQHLTSIAERGFMTGALFGRIKHDIGRYTCSCEIGSSKSEDEGMSASLTYNYVSNAAAAFASMGLPAGLGAAVTVDFLLRAELEADRLNRVKRAFEKLVEAHCLPELERLSTFKSWKVYDHEHETDQVRVLRVAFAFKPEASIDGVLRNLNLGLRLSELVPDFSASIRVSHSLIDILENKKMTLDDDVAATLSLSGVISRRAIARLAEELLRYAQEADIAAENDVGAKQHAHRTALSRTFGDKQPASTASDRFAFEESFTGFAAAQPTRTARDMSRGRWVAATAMSRLSQLISLVQGSKSSSAEFRFPNLSSVLFGTLLSREWFARWANAKWFRTVGGAAEAWNAASHWIEAQVGLHCTRLRQMEEMEAEWRRRESLEEASKLQSMSKRQRDQIRLHEEKLKMAETLRSMGMEVTSDIGQAAQPDADPVKFLRSLTTSQAHSEKDVLDAYGACLESLNGLHCIQVQSGTNRFSLTCHGFEIFEVLPEVQGDASN